MSGVPASFLAEIRKLRQRPAIWVSFGILVALLVLFGYVVSYIFYSHPPSTGPNQLPRGLSYDQLKQSLYPARFVPNTIGGGSQIGGVIAMIVGVLVQGSEYGWGTLKTLFTQRPGRLTIVAGKFAAVAVMTLVVAAVLLLVAAAVSFGLATVDGKSTAFPPGQDIVKGLLALWLILFFWSCFGIALATLFQQSAMAIGLGLAYGLVIEGLIFGLLTQFGGDDVRRIQQWFPIANATYLSSSFGRAIAIGREGKPFADATHGVVMLLVYVAAFIGVTAYFTRRRDVT